MHNDPNQSGGQPGVPAPSHRHTSQPEGAPGMGRPMQQPVYEPIVSAPPPSNNKALIGICAVGVVLAGLGLAKSFLSKPEPAQAQPVVRTPSPWEQQQQLMREALDMAREAQQMQREHQATMERAMEMEAMGEDW